MRVMVIVKANQKSEAGVPPTEQEMAPMGKFNDELAKAGILLSADGLLPTSRGARVRFPSKAVVDGPFTETKELIAGFWIWQVKSIEEALEWLKRAPFDEGEVEVRPFFELTDFELSAEARARYEARRALIAQKQ